MKRYIYIIGNSFIIYFEITADFLTEPFYCMLYSLCFFDTYSASIVQSLWDFHYAFFIISCGYNLAIINPSVSGKVPRRSTMRATFSCRIVLADFLKISSIKISIRSFFLLVFVLLLSPMFVFRLLGLTE